MTRRRIGRPSKLTKKVVDTLLEGLEVGMTFEGAATRAGISESTRLNWYNKGRDIAEKIEAVSEDVELTIEEAQLLDFFRKHDQAVANGQFFHWANLENHAPQEPSISQWILQNRHGIRPPAQRVEMTGADGGPIKTKDENVISDEERLARLAALLDAARTRRTGQAPFNDDTV